MPRKLEYTIETTATPEEVWSAIAQGDGIASWFAPEAKVEPGEGGSVWVSWGEGMAVTQKIEIWEPGKHLRVTEESLRPGQTTPMAIDYYIETDKGVTRMRLVHSGFGDSADWDNEIAGYEGGWTMFMGMLTYRLRRPDQPVQQATVFRVVKAPRAEAYARLTDPENGLVRLKGDTAFTVNGEQGTVEFLKPNFFRGIVPAWNDAMLNIFCEGARESAMVTVALMFFAPSVDQVAAHRAELSAAFDRIFPAPAA